MDREIGSERRFRIDGLVEKYRKLDSEGADLDLKLKDLDICAISDRFFSSHGRMKEKAAIIARSQPGERLSINETGKDVLAHKFTLLGYGPAEFGFPLKWHCDYRSSKEWASDIDFRTMGYKMFDVIVDRKGGFEVKFPWDLSNMMWIPTLACAYHLTGERIYAEAFRSDVSDWIERNPYPRGVNWICPMNIAIRAINIIVGLTGLHPVLEKDFIAKAVQSLFRHGVAIAAYPEIEKNDKRNNHYLTDLVGLYFLGYFFRDTEEGAEWLDFSKNELELEAEYQFYSDGVNFEDSTSYHRLSSEMLLLCAILARDNGVDFPKGFLERLHRGIGFTRDILQSNGRIPMFGDNDNGRILQFHGYSRIPSADHRHILAAGGEFFDDDSLRAPGKLAVSEAIWLLGRFAQPASRAINDFISLKKYAESGFYIVEHGNIKMVIRNSRINSNSVGGHAHCDPLSFTLSYGMQEIFVDPGTFLYSSDFEERNKFRSVEYHNTIQIGEDPLNEYDTSTFGGLWRMNDRAGTETVECVAKDECVSFSGKFSCRGYDVFRNLEYSKDSLSTTDSATKVSAETMGGHAFSRFMLAPGLEASVEKDSVVSIRKGSVEICYVRIMSDTCSIKINSMWVAPGYGTKLPAKQLVFSWLPEDSLKIKVLLNKDLQD